MALILSLDEVFQLLEQSVRLTYPEFAARRHHIPMTIAVKDDRVLGLVAADTDESFEDLAEIVDEEFG